MSSLALSFNEVKFNPVVRDNGQIYLTAGELAQALDYKSVKSVSNLYNANKDEFTDSMTQIIESVTAGNIEVTDSVTSKQTRNLKKKVRIFSLRGCHLIAMFARTAVAKQFRKWVLDILDKEVGAPVARTHKSERTPLHDAHALLVAKTKHLNSSEAWKIINQRFGTNHIDEIPYNMIPVAVEYVHHLIAMYSGAEKKEQGSLFDKDAYELVRKLTEAVIIENDEIVPVLLAVKMLDV
ncbi:alpha/beta hydrolase, partial [Acinetobacter baumannii]|nr:alpha/beta hydrolase [Acinetobacter baumannii]MCF4299289.1 alpha/beta hydrolase [Acinetobacter baumannii]MCF4426129.1 alpha/beta hydrolase [Acinetobacter baumannii]MCF4581693.1 alpha/beta hydrolase [Acinetobacter baumannii]MCF4619614.1 alpha/beta hydrolase [Acinetobacter baumannii]